MPPEWTSVRLDVAFDRSKKAGGKALEPLSVFTGQGVLPRASRDYSYKALSDDLSSYLVVQPGDLVFNKLRTWQGALGVSQFSGIVSPAYFVCRPRRDMVDSRYADYLLHAAPWAQELRRISKWMPPNQNDIAWDDLKTVPLALPPLATQSVIADFLDTETARIDALIEKKQRMVELLEERLFRVRAEETFSGTAIDGENDTQLVSLAWWAGQVPRTWPVVRLRDVVHVSNGYAFNSDDISHDSAGTPLIRIGDVVRGYTDTYVATNVPDSAYVNTGDLIVGLTGEFACGTWEGGRAALNQRVCRVLPRDRLSVGFLRTLLPLILLYLNETNAATTLKNLLLPDLLAQTIPLPPVPIQVRLAARFNRVQRSTHELSRLHEEGRVRLQEHRQALITAAVTGELQIPGVVA